MSTTTHLNELRINYLTQAQYDDALENDEINENELYFTPDSGGVGTPIPTANTTAMFDSNAYMNSDDMTSTEISDFLDELEPGGIVDGYMSLDTTAASGTRDGDLYAAISALSWQSEVIV